MKQNFITQVMVQAVNKVASENNTVKEPPYVMKHIPDEWMVFERGEWCYIPLKDGLKRISENAKKPLKDYGLTQREINAYEELLSVLGLPEPTK